jgi:hypothetical protein
MFELSMDDDSQGGEKSGGDHKAVQKIMLT